MLYGRYRHGDDYLTLELNEKNIGKIINVTSDHMVRGRILVTNFNGVTLCDDSCHALDDGDSSHNCPVYLLVGIFEGDK